MLSCGQSVFSAIFPALVSWTRVLRGSSARPLDPLPGPILYGAGLRGSTGGTPGMGKRGEGKRGAARPTRPGGGQCLPEPTALWDAGLSFGLGTRASMGIGQRGSQVDEVMSSARYGGPIAFVWGTLQGAADSYDGSIIP